MGGRFGKYGDLKRKSKLRRARIEKNRMDQLRKRSKRRQKDSIKPQSKFGMQIEIEISESNRTD